MFIKDIINGNLILLISEVIIKELSKGPGKLIELLHSLPTSNIELVMLNNEIMELADKYLIEKIVSEKYKDDSIHVAAATVSKADAIVSWNFKHIVRLDKIKQYNYVNSINGYGFINIITPMELNYEHEE